jgi:transportin-3
MAISALAVHMSWTTALTDIATNILTPHPDLGPAVLELYRSIPEEADSTRLVLTGGSSSSSSASGGGNNSNNNNDDEEEEERSRMLLYAYKDMLRNSAHIVLSLCTNEISNTNNDIATTEAVLGCLQVWIRLVDIDPNLLAQSSLLGWIFDIASQGSNAGGYELAIDVIVELLRTYPSTTHNNGDIENLVLSIIPRVMSLEVSLQQSILHEDEDGTRGYCRIFTEMAESYLSLILSHEELNQKTVVELVLRCSCIPDDDIACITLHFWYRFVTSLEELEPYEYRQIQIDTYTPILIRLLGVCVHLLQYPMGIEDVSPDRLDDLDNTRLYFSDTIEDCCRLLGGEVVLRALGDPLQEECHRVSLAASTTTAAAEAQQQQQQQQCTTNNWHGMEGYLYAIQAISMYIPPDETRTIPFVMGLIPQLSVVSDVPLLRATTCLVVGKYASWLSKHPVYLSPLLPYLAQSLSIPKCATPAAVAIREICERCDTLGDTVLELYDGIVIARTQHNNGGGGEEFILDLKNELEVLEGVCKSVSSRVMIDPTIIQHLAQPMIDNLRAMAAADANPTPKHISSEVCRLTTLVQHLRLPRPSQAQQQQHQQHQTIGGGTGLLNRSDFILSLMHETWPMLDILSQKYPRDFNCGEKLCRLHKHALRECGAVPYTPLLQSLVQQTITNFSTSLSSPYLYLASVIISEYGRDVTHSKLLFDMMSSLASTVFTALQSTDDFTNHPDVVEEFFFLAGRMVSHCPTPLVQSMLLPSLLQCAALGMKLQHKDANRGTLNFLENIVSYSLKLRSSNALDGNEQANMVALERAIVAEGQPLVINLALALLGDLPAYRLDSGSGSIAGVLFYLNQLCPELLLQWIQPPLTTAPEHAKSVFLVKLHNRVARDEFNSSVRKFTAVCERSRLRKV